MGSGSKRKTSDKPIIRNPKTRGGGNPGRPEKVASLCPLSFEQKVVGSTLTKKGVKVQLSKKGERYSMDIFGNSIGFLNSRSASMVKECETMGIKYVGQIVIKQNEEKSDVYARFSRTME